MATKLHAVDLLPHKRLIDALLLGKYKQAQVNEFLLDRGFETISNEHYKVIAKRLERAFPEHFVSQDSASTEAIDKSGVREMYAYLFDKRYFLNDSPPIEEFDAAFKAYSLPQTRKALKAMAFAQISEEEIELYANAKYGDGYNTETYMIFFKYFFDPFEWSYQVRREYMEREPNKDLRNLYTLGLTKDKDFIVWKLGLAPTKTFADMLEDMTRDAYYNFKEQSTINPDAAMKWATLGLRAMEKIKEVEPGADKNTNFDDEFRILLKPAVAQSTTQSAEALGVEIPDFKGTPDNG